MTTVLVTGATGFIGNYVIAELLKQDIAVIATSSNKEKAKQYDWFNKVNYKPLDFTKLDNSVNYYDYFGKPDLLIHLAWEGLPNYKNEFHITENLPRHSLFIENLITNGLKNITITGTCFEYGMQEGKLSEDMICYPDNAYAIAKDRLRVQIEKIQLKVPKLIFKWIRLFYMFGNGQNPNSLFLQLTKALHENRKAFNMSGGDQIRDFLPVETVADNIVKIAFQNNITGIINCCSGIPITVKQFIENYLISVNKNIKLNLGYYPYSDLEPMKFWGDNSKLYKIIENAG